MFKILSTGDGRQAMGILLMGILVAGGLASPSQAESRPPLPAHEPQGDLATLRVVMKRVEAHLPRPAKVSATQVKENGVFATQDLGVAWTGVMRRFLPVVRSAHPVLIGYWVVRTEDPNFAARASKVVGSTRLLSPWAGRLETASATLIREASQALFLTVSDAPAEERNAMRRASELDGTRRAVAAILQEMLAAVGELDPARNVAWTPLYELLKQDIEQEWTSHSNARNENERVSFQLSPAYYGAYKLPAATTAHFETLELIGQRLARMRAQVLENALAHGQSPMAFLEGDARAFIDTQIEFDRALARALDSAEVRAGPSLVRPFVGMYDIWRSLERQEDFLLGGQWTQSVGLLIEVTRLVQKSHNWRNWKEIDPDTGKSTSDFVVQRAGQTIDLLNNYKDRRLPDGAPQGPLYAVIEVDAQGRRVWTHSGWILWKWLTASDVEDLEVDGRVVDGLGRRWLLPAGSPLRSIRSLQDVHTANAGEVIVALDPSGAWTGASRVTR